MICPNCKAENRSGRKFCLRCGGELALECPACGAANEADASFCGDCGAALAGRVAGAGGGLEQAPPADGGRAAERRLVSVLFADLVGFTSFSEDRDAEEVRELLSRYFDAARRIIARYGGTLEKFIGDAVMAVWGTPVAQEDDAERAVRAGLDLTAAVAALGAEIGASHLQARAGVLTGEAAVTVGGSGEGMVAGDLVNSASRVQSVAAPGSVLVGESTRRATAAAITYSDAGTFELKGKVEPVTLWRADRVIGSRGGALKATGLEPPFVGRAREIHRVKELFNACADDGKAHLVSVVGQAGIGKSRLAWEFYKYVDGLAHLVYWQRGRCLAYGEGVAYWALADMVRMRAGIAEEEDPAAVPRKLRVMLEAHIQDDDERAWIETRLGALLGIEDRVVREREDLFAGWRLFFERLAEKAPTVLVFEDLHWADQGLLDFIEYLFDWSRNHPLFVMTLARPEIAEQRRGWGADKRNFSSLFLDPLDEDAMDELLCGLVPGLSQDLGARIRERAEGVPLYAVETVRMLLDRGLLEKEGDVYRPTRSIEALEVPETLHALIAARLDGLPDGERRLLQHASVIGKSFTKDALSACTDLDPVAVERLLESLVRKELFALHVDPRSPERGHYGFLQALVQKVAYDTLGKKERRARHLRVAEYLEHGWGGDEAEIAELVAAHYLDAHRAAPQAPDAADIKLKARAHLRAAADRAAALGARDEAQRYYEQAAELEEDAVAVAGLLEQAGDMAGLMGRIDEAIERFTRAVALLEQQGASHAAARVSTRLADPLWDRGEITKAVELLENAFALLRHDPPDEDLATLGAQLGRIYHFTGRSEEAVDPIEFALEIAEKLYLPGVLSQALNTKHLILDVRHRFEESSALLRHALRVAREHGEVDAGMRALYNLVGRVEMYDAYEEAVMYQQEGLEESRRLGMRTLEWFWLGVVYGHYALGRWDEALARVDELPPPEASPSLRTVWARLVPPLLFIHDARDDDEAIARVVENFHASDEIQERGIEATLEGVVALRAGDAEHALQRGGEALRIQYSLGYRHVMKEELVYAVEPAFALDRLDRVAQLLDEAAPDQGVRVSPVLKAHIARLGARLDARRGDDATVGARFDEAARSFRELKVPFWLGVTLLEHAEWLGDRDEPSEAGLLLAEAGPIFERLRARPYLDRMAKLQTTLPT